jgi:hypothetical protein
MTKDEMRSIEKGDVIYYPPSEEWWHVVGFRKKYKFFGKRLGAKVVAENGFMKKFGVVCYSYCIEDSPPGFLNFYKHGILLKEDTPKQRLAVILKYGTNSY